MPKIPIALQLYTVRDEAARDFPGTLDRVAEIGYAGVELAGYHGMSVRDLKARLDDLHLSVAGTTSAWNVWKTRWRRSLTKTSRSATALSSSPRCRKTDGR